MEEVVHQRAPFILLRAIKGPRSRLCVWVLSIFGPLIVYAAFWCLRRSLIITGNPGRKALAEMGGFCILNLAIWAGAWNSWRLLRNAAPRLDEMLPDGARQTHAQWFRRALSRTRQLAYALLVVCTAAALIHYAFRRVHAIGYITVCWAGAVGSQAVYMIFIGMLLIFRLSRERAVLNLNRLWPARTQGLVAYSWGTIFVGAYSVLGALATFWLGRAAQPSTSFQRGLVTNHAHGTVLAKLVIYALPSLAVFCAILVVAVPYFAIRHIIRKWKTNELEALYERVHKPRPLSRTESDEAVRMYLALCQSPDTPVALSSFAVAYSSSLLGSFVAYLLNLHAM
jgi:hypothetical protein